MKILVTGAAGFIGYHLVKQLIDRGDDVVGIDNINDYYDVGLKYARLNQSGITNEDIAYGKAIYSNKYSNYKFFKLDLTDTEGLKDLFLNAEFDYVCNLAAQAGVRYSLTNPDAYIESNIKGFLNILECSRQFSIKHLLYASSSSVYGLNTEMPFSASQNVDHPISLYAASKKSNELMAHCYSHLFNLPTTGLRFFTVYGPWGRPDMALFLFTKNILEDKPIDVFNYGSMQRDFTYIDDIITCIIKALEHPAEANHTWDGRNPDPASSKAPYRIFNMGNGVPVSLSVLINEIEKNVGKSGKKIFLSMQDGDMTETWADIDDFNKMFNYKPNTSIKEGVKSFVRWYMDFYRQEQSTAQEKDSVITEFNSHKEQTPK